MEGNNSCSGDDLACWPRAQVNLLHTVANASGCTVLLVGDFHYSDLKVIQPGDDHQYADALQTGRLRKPVYQVRLAAAVPPALLCLRLVLCLPYQCLLQCCMHGRTAWRVYNVKDRVLFWTLLQHRPWPVE